MSNGILKCVVKYVAGNSHFSKTYEINPKSC